MATLRAIIGRILRTSIIRWLVIILVAFFASAVIAIAFVLLPGVFISLLKMIG